MQRIAPARRLDADVELDNFLIPRELFDAVAQMRFWICAVRDGDEPGPASEGVDTP